MTARSIVPVFREVRFDQLDQDAERLSYWKSRTPAERIAEVESFPAMFEVVGCQDDEGSLVSNHGHRRILRKQLNERYKPLVMSLLLMSCCEKQYTKSMEILGAADCEYCCNGDGPASVSSAARRGFAAMRHDLS